MKTILSIIAVLFTTLSIAQTPHSFKYQGVMRDAQDQLYANQDIQVRIQVVQDYPNGTVQYVERHPVTTNNYGVFSLNVFEGFSELGSPGTIDWAQGPYHLMVEVDMDGGANYEFMGASELLSVPYALYGEDDDANPFNELQNLQYLGVDSANQVYLLTMTNSSDTARIPIISTGSDSDSNPTNEIQQISKVGKAITLNQGGGTINLLDDDPSNELQKLSKTGSKIRLNNNGGEVSLNDDDASNEIQKLTKKGADIELSKNGGKISLKDDDATNEIQRISFSNGQLSLSKNGGRVTVPVSPFDVDRFGNISTDKNVTLDGFVTSRHWIEANRINVQNLTTQSIAMDGGNTKLEPRSLNFNNGGYFSVNANGRQVFIAGGAFANGQWLPAIILKTGTYEGGLSVGQGGKIDARAQRMYAENFIQTSDQRLKTDISSLDNVMDKVMQMSPKSYRFKSDDAGERQIGFLAQEIERIFPEIVDYDAENDRYALSYTDFSVVAIKAIQEQQKEIEALKILVQQLLDK